MTTPRVSVVLCTRDRPHLLESALGALHASVRHGDEVIVVDSASRTGATADVARAARFPSIRVDEPGLSRARNAGLGATSHELVAFTDDDCLVDRDWIEAIAGGFADHATGLVTGRLVPEEPGRAPAADAGDAPIAFGATSAVEAFGAGANMAVRRAALVAIGGFDERMGAGTRLQSGEDHDAFWRILRAGWRGRYLPDAVVVHRRSRDKWELVSMRYGSGLGAGALAAKVTKVDPHNGRRMLLRRMWRDGVRQVGVDVGRRYERAALSDVLFATGVIVGAASVWRTPLAAGHLARREAQEGT